ncbi:MAG TPA: UDP-N-acetylmuramoyl-L-alanyl-D-glutamate--2,6-diaminopimelate ligase [Kineosporiaceae bacterium]
MPIPGGPRPVGASPRPLSEIRARIRARPAPWSPPPAAPADVRVTGVTLSSLAVRPGDLYAALPGAHAHGAAYTGQAVRAGAVAVLTDPAGQELIELAGADVGVPVLVVPQPRAVLGDLAAWIYGEPGQRLLTFGVTGTNGKTTTTFLLESALRRLERRTGLIGTIEIRVGTERVLSTGTTPEAPDLHALLAVMCEHEVTAVAMEVSSHALDQRRVDGLLIDVAGFTNLSQDHLDYHHTLQAYFEAKAQLFTPRHARCGVICVDDAWGRRLAATAAVPVTTVASRLPEDGGAPADWQVRRRTPARGGLTAIELDGPAGALALTCPLPGDFNIANTVLAVAMLAASGVDPTAAAAAVQRADAVPGRMEPVTGTGRPGEPLAVVDYAHTPDAVEAALAALTGRGWPLVVVLGAGGDRDAAKRPRMGAAAARAADVVIVTDDNPRSEDPAAIRAAVLRGAAQEASRSGAVVLEIADRRSAVAEGVARAWQGGVLLVAGKGHEQGQDAGGVVLPFDDRVVVHEVLCTVQPRAVDRTAGAPVSGPDRGGHQEQKETQR